MATRNDITGDSITTRTISEKFRNNYDAIFGKNKIKEAKEENHANREVETRPPGRKEGP